MSSYSIGVNFCPTDLIQDVGKYNWVSLEELISKYAMPSAFLPFLNFLIDSSNGRIN